MVDGVQNTQTASWYDGKRSIVLAVQRQPNANTVAVVDAVKAELPQLYASMPGSMTLSILNDRSTSIRSAISDVKTTLGITIVLVVLVIYLFLGKICATLIPALAVPLSLVAAFGGMYFLGFSVDNISLLGLTLAVGLVVDDAIVMLENIMRHIEEGEKPFAAALAAVARDRRHDHLDDAVARRRLPADPADGRRHRPPLQRIRRRRDDGDRRLRRGVADADADAGCAAAEIGRRSAALGSGGLVRDGLRRHRAALRPGVGWCLAHRFIIIGLFLATVGAIRLSVHDAAEGLLPARRTSASSRSRRRPGRTSPSRP